MESRKVNFSIFFNHIKRFLPSSECPLCLAEIEYTQRINRFICHFCHQRLPILGQSCQICAMPIAQNQAICGRCLQNTPAFSQTVAAFHYESPVSDFIASLKYSARFHSLALLCDYLSNAIKQTYGFTSGHPKLAFPEILLPVPLHTKKLKQRGFNQATEITKYLSKSLSLPYSNRHIERIKDTPPQADLDAAARRKNLKDAFRVMAPLPGHCAVVDDVMTTGSSANEIATCLLKAGARRVDIWCVARAFPVD